MTDEQAAIQRSIMQYVQDSDNIHQEMLAHSAFQSNVLVACVVVLIVLSFICAFRRAN